MYFRVTVDWRYGVNPLLVQNVERMIDEQDICEGEGDYHLKVTVNYKKGRPPRCVVITSKNREEWGAEEVGALDAADLKKVDVLVNGWWSDMAGGGYGGFLKTIFVTLNEDELELMYAGNEQSQSPSGDSFGDDPVDDEG